MNQRLSTHEIELGRRVNLVALVGRHVKLVRKGRVYWGQCPFHRDNSPSFKVENERGRYHCFGCGADGDAFGWLMATEGVTFPEAVRQLSSQSVIGNDVTTATSETPEWSPSNRREDAQERTRLPLRIWRETVPIVGTPGERYFVDTRCLDVTQLDIGHVLRWHSSCAWESGTHGCLVGLYTDAKTNEPRGIHRTAITTAGIKVDRKALGPIAGCVLRLSPDDAVTHGLGIVEGIEDGLAIILKGWRPIWAAGSAGAIAKFPALSGIEALTIFADSDVAGMKAATECTARWRDAGCNVAIIPPVANG